MHPLVKKIALYFLSNRFLLKIKINLINNRKNTVTILNLHSVTDNISKFNKLTPKLFEDLVIFVTKNFTLVAFLLKERLFLILKERLFQINY